MQASRPCTIRPRALVAVPSSPFPTPRLRPRRRAAQPPQIVASAQILRPKVRTPVCLRPSQRSVARQQRASRPQAVVLGRACAAAWGRACLRCQEHLIGAECCASRRAPATPARAANVRQNRPDTGRGPFCPVLKHSVNTAQRKYTLYKQSVCVTLRQLRAWAHRVGVAFIRKGPSSRLRSVCQTTTSTDR